MKKLLSAAMLMVSLVVMLGVITPAYAGDADGLWYSPLPDNSGPYLAMTRVNGGSMLFTFLDCWGWRMADWVPLFGSFDGTTGNLSVILTSEANGNMPQSATATFTLTSATTAKLTISSCVNFPNQNNCPPDGTVLNLTKIF